MHEDEFRRLTRFEMCQQYLAGNLSEEQRLDTIRGTTDEDWVAATNLVLIEAIRELNSTMKGKQK